MRYYIIYDPFIYMEAILYCAPYDDHKRIMFS